MAMDAALLSLAIRRDDSVVRIYRWSEPTVSLGYFQANTDLSGNPFPNLRVVRRLSGGGAILHDREWTYSCVLPPSHPARQDPSSLYVTVHNAIIDLLGRCGVPCCLRSDFRQPVDESVSHESAVESAASAVAVQEPFLCFLRGNPNDIVHELGPKIVGSAQRRRQGVILQHGSVLLQASPQLENLPGVLDLSPDFPSARFAEQFPDCVAAAVSSAWHRREYSAEELELAEQIQREG
jgi:lipoate-protein ligase A